VSFLLASRGFSSLAEILVPITIHFLFYDIKSYRSFMKIIN